MVQRTRGQPGRFPHAASQQALGGNPLADQFIDENQNQRGNKDQDQQPDQLLNQEIRKRHKAKHGAEEDHHGGNPGKQARQDPLRRGPVTDIPRLLVHFHPE